MSKTSIAGVRIDGISTCVPTRVIDNASASDTHGEEEVRKVMAMAGVKRRRVVEPGICSSNLCTEAAAALLDGLGWERNSIDAVIMVTQSPDYFLPSTACLIHRDLSLGAHCAAFDVGLGCSGYPYGLYLASAMINSGGHDRVLLLHGETPSLFTTPEDRATSLLFGDAGSAIALSRSAQSSASHFNLCTDGRGYGELIIRGGGFRDRHPERERDIYLFMDGAAVFNFTIQRVPALIRETLELSGKTEGDLDGFLFHQSNQFIMRYLAKKCSLPPEKTPIILAEFGNTGGASIPLAATISFREETHRRTLKLMMLGYGVGLSWAAAIVDLPGDSLLLHKEFTGAQLAA